MRLQYSRFLKKLLLRDRYYRVYDRLKQ